MAKSIGIVRSYRDGQVGIGIETSISGFGGGSVKVKASIYLTIAETRELAGDLIRAADEMEAKEAKKLAAAERREKWRQREIAAGRIRIISPRNFLNRPAS